MGSRLEKSSKAVQKRIEGHTFDDETGEEYEGSKFGGFSDYFRRKKLKLQNLDAEIRSSSTDKPQIFKGVVAHVNGYTQPTLSDIHSLIVRHGGGFMQYLDGKTTVTHIIAANLTPKKAVEFRRYRIVKPAWVVESVHAGKLLPWENFRVLDEGVGQKLLKLNDGRISTQVSTRPRSYREQTNTSWYTSQVKNVADNIDDNDGAHFPSAQPVLSNPESFELTSSMEDAFNAATGYPTNEKIESENFAHVGNTILNSVEEIKSHPEQQALNQVSRKRSHSVDPPTVAKRQHSITAEEHNALLLQDPHIRKSSTGNPNFIRQYYAESRLHHLSTWKADLKSKLQLMAAEKSLSQRAQQKRNPGSRRYIMHVDFDSFFCAVSLKSAPQYADKPAVVAHGSGNGSEIASCNYPARAFGVKNGMWMKRALELCPTIKVLPYDYPGYEEASKSFYEAIIDLGGIVQSVSIDEALVDISLLVLPDINSGQEDGICQEQERADQLAQILRARIKEKTGCAVSVGIGRNVLLAKVALRKAKPAGQHQIKPEEELDFIGELAVQNLPGVAYSIGGKLEEIGVKFVKDIRSLTKERLISILGPKTGQKIWEYSRGIDSTEIGEQVMRKSVSAEVNWGIRFISQPDAEEFVQNLCVELHRRLLEQMVRGRQLTMKIMKRASDAPMDPPKNLGHGKCDTFNKSVTLGVATNSAEAIGREAVSILRSYGFSPGELRGLGVQMTKLEPFKSGSGNAPDGSQRRIAFNTPAAEKRRRECNDPIVDPDSPVKRKLTPIHPAKAIIKANETDVSAKKPLNITGTQFLLPTQVDPSVLAELPMDIRSRLMAPSKSRSTSREQSPAVKPRSESPAFRDTHIPSQLDREVFNALPDDVKAEVLASYPSHAGPSRAQAILPQSPRKNRTLASNKKQTTPTKKRVGLLSWGRNKNQHSNSTLTQSNFVSGQLNLEKDASMESSDELDQEFLAALPEDVREEVLAEHKRARLARRSGLMTTSNLNKKRRPLQPENYGQRKLKLALRPPKPTFTTQELSTAPELRNTIKSWYDEFKDEGPDRGDVGAMERYLRRVVLEEKDIAKVVGVIKWISWVIDDDESNDNGKKAWNEAVEGIKERVQEAIRERGLGKVAF
jgi:DNA repair protein REV1